jgi:hypothetical protein
MLMQMASLKKQVSQTEECGNENGQDAGDSDCNCNALKKPK